MRYTLLPLIFCALVLTVNAQVFDPNDKVTIFNPRIPPTKPSTGHLAKWVVTPNIAWDASSWKPYYYNGMPFRLRFPDNYDPSSAHKYPVSVLLHGRGFSKGTIYMNDRHLNNSGAAFYEVAIKEGRYDGFVLSPQGTFGFFGAREFETISAILGLMEEQLSVDLNRISVNGRSGGAFAIWKFIASYPRLFAAAVPMSGALPEFITGVNGYKYTPIWLFQGGLDDNPSPQMAELLVNRIRQSGGNIRYTLYPNDGHGIFDRGYQEEDFFDYISSAHKANPHVLFDRREFCALDEVDLVLGLTPGYEGYEWRKDGIGIENETSNELHVTEPGRYMARFKQAGKWSVWSPEPVDIQLKMKTVTPLIRTVDNMSYFIPTPSSSEVILELPEGFETYTWVNTATMDTLGNERVFTTTKPGIYAAAVTEKYGCTTVFSEPFRVYSSRSASAPNKPEQFSASLLNDSEVLLQWGLSSSGRGATYLEIFRSNTQGGPYQKIALMPTGSRSYTDTELTANTDYYYVARAVDTDSEGASDITNESRATTTIDTETPTAPSLLRAISVGTHSIDFDWDPADDNEGLDRYELYRGDVKVAVVREDRATVYNLSANQTAVYTVRAVDMAGNISLPSNRVTVSTQNPGLRYKYYEGSWNRLPDFNRLTPIDSGTVGGVDLSPRLRNNEFAFLWEGQLHVPETGVYTFKTRSVNGSKLYLGGYGDQYLVVDNDGKHGLRTRAGTVYLEKGQLPITIAYTNGLQDGFLEVSWANTAHGIVGVQKIPAEYFSLLPEALSFPPAKPSALQGHSSSDDSIALQWSDNSDNETGFRLFRSTSPLGPYEKIADLPANSTEYMDTDITTNSTYYYKVSALNSYGETLSTLALSPRSNWRFNGSFINEKGESTAKFLSHAVLSKEAIEGSHSLFLNGKWPIEARSLTGLFNTEFSKKTLALWIKPNETQDRQVIFEQGGDGNGIALRLKEGRLEGAVSTGGKRRIISAPFTDTGWNHVALVFNKSALILYINGEEAAGEYYWAFDLIKSHTDKAGLGNVNSTYAFGDEGGQYKGHIDDLYLFDEALRSRDIRELMESVTTIAQVEAPKSPPLPKLLIDLSLQALSPKSIALQWEDNGTPSTVFEIYRSEGDDSTFSQIARLAGSTDKLIDYVDYGLKANTTYFYKIKASEEASDRSTDSNIATSTSLNTPPSLSGATDIVLRYDSTVVIHYIGEDVDGGTLSFRTKGLPYWARFSVEGKTGLLTLAPEERQQGTYRFDVISEDSFGGADTITCSLLVNDNYLPSLSKIDDFSLMEGDIITRTLNANDKDLTMLKWYSETLPSWASITVHPDNTATLELSPGFTAAGQYEVDIAVSDDITEVVQSFSIYVEDKDPYQRVLLNLGELSNTVSPWNTADSTYADNLLDENSESSSIVMSIRGTEWSADSTGVPHSDDTMTRFPNSVRRNHFYFEGDQAVTIELSGLDPSQYYNLILLGSSRAGNGTEHTVYRIGTVADTVLTTGNVDESVHFAGVQPDALGKIRVELGTKEIDQKGYLNAMIIEKTFEYTGLPASPLRFQALLQPDGSVGLEWEDTPFNELGYTLYRASHRQNVFRPVHQSPIPANTVRYRDKSPIENTEYYYKLLAFNQNGNSAFSITDTVHTPNKAPVLEALKEVDAYLGENTKVTITASDFPLDQIELSASGLPDFASFTDLGDGQALLSITPSANEVTRKYEGIQISAKDAFGSVVTLSYAFEVMEKPSYTVPINFGSKDNVGLPWNNTAKTPQPGDVFTNLTNGLGEATDLVLTLEGNVSGVQDRGAVTGANTGIYPDKVLQEYYWHRADSPEAFHMTISGLGLREKYNFRFVGSHATDGGTTFYAIDGDTVRLSVLDNTENDAVLKDLYSNEQGEITLTIGAEGGKGAFINALTIEAFEVDPKLLSPSLLHVTGISDSTVELNWSDNSLDETGFEIFRSTTGADGPYSLLHHNTKNTNTYTDSGLTPDNLYHYKVRAETVSGYSDFSNIAGGSPIRFAVKININGNVSFDQATPWNNLSILPLNGDVSRTLLNEQGDETGFKLRFLQAMEGSNEWGVQPGQDSGLYPDKVMGSFFFNDAFSSRGHVVIKGLQQGHAYNLTFFGSIRTTEDIRTTFTIGDQSITNNQKNNSTETVSILGVTPDINNEIAFFVQEASGSRWAIFNAMVIEAYSVNGPSITSSKINVHQLTPQASHRERWEQEKSKMSMKIFPNPFKGTVHLQMKGVPKGKSMVQVFDSVGKRLITKETDEKLLSEGMVMDFIPLRSSDRIFFIKVILPDGKVFAQGLLRK